MKIQEKNYTGFIQYLVDNELCYRLFQAQGIPYEYGQNQHHDIDEGTFKNMYPFFVGYLYRNEENCIELIKENMDRNRAFSSDKKGNILYSVEAIAEYFKRRLQITPYEFAGIDFNKEVQNLWNKKIRENDNSDDLTL